nr:hypothetical protein [Microbacterium sp. SORGH_AS_0888]
MSAAPPASGPRERLDPDPTAVAVVERLPQHAGDVDRARAEPAATGLPQLQIAQPRQHEPDRRRHVGLLDRHVEGVQMDAEMRGAAGLDVGEGLGGRVDGRLLVAVEDLEGELDAAGRRVVGHGPHLARALLEPLGLHRRGRVPEQPVRHAVELVGADAGREIDRLAQHGGARGPLGGVGRGDVRPRRLPAHHDRGDVGVVEDRAEGGGIRPLRRERREDGPAVPRVAQRGERRLERGRRDVGRDRGEVAGEIEIHDGPQNTGRSRRCLNTE